jgi:hypothetical protein
MNTIKPLVAKPKMVMKPFEICLDHNPTDNEQACLKNIGATWQGHHVVRAYPTKIVVLEHDVFKTNPKDPDKKFWTLTFDVEEGDWLFWCGFIAAKMWNANVGNRDVAMKDRARQADEYTVTI